MVWPKCPPGLTSGFDRQSRDESTDTAEIYKRGGLVCRDIRAVERGLIRRAG